MKSGASSYAFSSMQHIFLFVKTSFRGTMIRKTAQAASFLACLLGTALALGAGAPQPPQAAPCPAQWKQVLVVHAHSGPELGAPRAERTEEDLKRWAVTVKAGYGWVASTCRRGGYGVTMAAEDTERARKIFAQYFGQPRSSA
jgi:hypothetical protein